MLWQKLEDVELTMQSRAIRMSELRPGMVLQSDVLFSDGTLLLARGNTLSPTLLQCLKRYSTSRGLREPLEVLVPPDNKT